MLQNDLLSWDKKLVSCLVLRVLHETKTIFNYTVNQKIPYFSRLKTRNNCQYPSYPSYTGSIFKIFTVSQRVIENFFFFKKAIFKGYLSQGMMPNKYFNIEDSDIITLIK